jgi:hypothetical protein
LIFLLSFFFFLFFFFIVSSFPCWTLQSKADPHLLKGLLPVSSVSWSLFPVFEFPFVNTCLYTVPPALYNESTFQFAVLLSLILFQLQSRCCSVWLFRGHNWGFLTSRIYYGGRSSACRPTPNLVGQSTVAVTPTYTSRHRVLLLVSFYDLIGLQWYYSFPRSPHGNEFSGQILLINLSYFRFVRQLTACSIVLERCAIAELVNKLPNFYGNRHRIPVPLKWPEKWFVGVY